MALPDGARIGIPNDPTDGGRALLLQDLGLPAPTKGTGLVPTPAPIINTNHALAGGLDPNTDHPWKKPTAPM